VCHRLIMRRKRGEEAFAGCNYRESKCESSGKMSFAGRARARVSSMAKAGAGESSHPQWTRSVEKEEPLVRSKEEAEEDRGKAFSPGSLGHISFAVYGVVLASTPLCVRQTISDDWERPRPRRKRGELLLSSHSPLGEIFRETGKASYERASPIERQEKSSRYTSSS